MHLEFEPNVGAGQLRFGIGRSQVRKLLPSTPIINSMEPENDFYESEGLILGYDLNEQLEYIEVIRPSSATYKEIEFFSLNLCDCLTKMKNRGYSAPYDDSGYNFETIGVSFYCPQENLESVSFYKKGYYDDL